MPNLPLAITMLLLRFSISQMDVPTRQSYVMAVVPPEERSAAAGITGVAPGVLGTIFFAANALAGLSGLYAVRLARRIGLIRTMVVTHIPSNVLLILVPLMPNLPLAIGVLLLRFSISQMDVPTRQAYTMAAVAPDERSAAAGVTGIARTTGAAISPILAGPMLAVPALAGLPFFLAGGLKLLYDLLLYRSFKASDAGKSEK
jgi:MFS family permease